MSASPTNTILELKTESGEPRTADRAPLLIPAPSGREALQGLLAFSSLQEQIRRKRLRNLDAGENGSPSDEAEIEQFMLDEVLHLVAERALSITGADGVAIALVEGGQIVCRATSGSVAPDRGARLDLNSSFSGACFRNEQVVRCDDSESDARVNVQACRRLGARSMVAVPLSGRHNVIGVLEAFSSEAYGFNDSDVRSLNLLGELILAAIRPEEEAELEQVAARLSDKEDQEQVSTVPAEVKPEPEQVCAAAPPVVSSRETEARPPVAVLRNPQARSARPGLVLVLTIVVVAALAGSGLWWKIHSQAHEATVEAQTRAAAVTPAPKPEPATPSPVAVAPMDMASTPVVEEKLAVLPKVTGIRHWSATDSSTVVIDLQDQVQYEAHRLSSPDRIYFDLHDTALAPGLAGKIFEIGDALLVRVRIAQPTPGVTRVVLETSGDPNFSVSMEQNPYRLVAELRAVGAKPQSRARFDMFAPSAKTEPGRPAPGSGEDARLRAQTPKFRIVLDAGHGGWDLGTVGRKGLLEKDLVLDVTQRLGELLSKRLNAEVVYTRQDDTYIPLEDRAGIANQAQADLFLSVHANYSQDASARGVETYFTNTFSSVNARSRTVSSASLQNINWGGVDIREKVLGSRRFAASVQNALYGMLAESSPGIRNRGVKEASYVVLTGAMMPAVLAEISFVSSPRDENNLQSAAYRQQIARALYKGVARYAASSQRVKLASTSGKPSGR